jgi:hypothetical protein
MYLYKVIAWNEGGESPSNVAPIYSGLPMATDVTVTSDTNPSVAGDPVTFTATLSSTFETGSVVFTVDGIDSPAVTVMPPVPTSTSPPALLFMAARV